MRVYRYDNNCHKPGEIIRSRGDSFDTLTEHQQIVEREIRSNLPNGPARLLCGRGSAHGRTQNWRCWPAPPSFRLCFQGVSLRTTEYGVARPTVIDQVAVVTKRAKSGCDRWARRRSSSGFATCLVECCQRLTAATFTRADLWAGCQR
jgi:hypothetical protein